MIQNIIWHICTWLMPVIHYFWIHLSTIRKSMMPLIGHAHSLKMHPLDQLIFRMEYAPYGHLVYSQHPEVWNGTRLPWECWREKAGGGDLIALADSGLFLFFFGKVIHYVSLVNNLSCVQTVLWVELGPRVECIQIVLEWGSLELKCLS